MQLAVGLYSLKLLTMWQLGEKNEEVKSGEIRDLWWTFT